MQLSACSTGCLSTAWYQIDGGPRYSLTVYQSYINICQWCSSHVSGAPLSQGFPTFNDDIESTAAAVVASMLGAVQMRNVPPLKKQHFLLFGAGQANIGSARLLLRALVGEGLSMAEARKRIWLYDSKVGFNALARV